MTFAWKTFLLFILCQWSANLKLFYIISSHQDLLSSCSLYGIQNPKPQQNSETLRSGNFNFIVNLRQENLSRFSQKACNTLLTRGGGSSLERLSSTAKPIFVVMNLYPQNIMDVCFPWSFKKKEDRRSENSSRKSRIGSSCSKQKGCILLLCCLKKRTVQFSAHH